MSDVKRLVTIKLIRKQPNSDHRTIMIDWPYTGKQFTIFYYEKRITISGIYSKSKSHYNPIADFFHVSTILERSVSRDWFRIALERIENMLDVGSGYSAHESNLEARFNYARAERLQIKLEKLEEQISRIKPRKDFSSETNNLINQCKAKQERITTNDTKKEK